MEIIKNFILWCLLFCSCTKSSPEKYFLIGEVDAFTGPEASFGENTYRGITIAIEQINQTGGIFNMPIKLLKADSQGKPDEAARAASKLIMQDRVHLIITGASSSGAMAIAPITQEHKIPLIATAATDPKLTQYGESIFRVCFIDPFQGKMVAKFAHNTLKVKKVAILRDVRTDYSIGLADVFTTTFKEFGGEIVIDQSYTSGDIDFKSQLTAIRSKQPEAIFIPGYYTDVSLIARQVKDLGITIPLLGTDGWDSPKLLEIAKDAIKGSYFSSFYSSLRSTEKMKKFSDSYQSTFSLQPDGSAVMAYEAMQFAYLGLKKLKSLERTDLDQLTSLLQNSGTMDLLTGSFYLDKNRNAVRSISILKISPTGTFEHFAAVQP